MDHKPSPLLKQQPSSSFKPLALHINHDLSDNSTHEHELQPSDSRAIQLEENEQVSEPVQTNEGVEIVSDLVMIQFSRKVSLDEVIPNKSLLGLSGSIKPEPSHVRECLQAIEVGRGKELPSLSCLKEYSLDMVILANGFDEFTPEDVWQCEQNLLVRVGGIDHLHGYVSMAENQIHLLSKFRRLKKVVEKLHIIVYYINAQVWLLINQKPTKQLLQKYLCTHLLVPLHISEKYACDIKLSQIYELLEQKKQRPHSYSSTLIEDILHQQNPIWGNRQSNLQKDDSFFCFLEEEDEEETLVMIRSRSKSADTSPTLYQKELQERNQLLQLEI